METPPQVTFRNMDHSDAVAVRIRDEAAKLERFFDRIIGYRVTVEAPHKQHNKGNLYRVQVIVEVPGKDIVVKKAPGDNHAHEDVYVAVRDAFKAAQRLLQDHARRGQGKVKTHEAPPHGRIVRLFPNEGYGFIESSEGLEVYFHRNAVANNAFDTLTEGTEVRFHESRGDKGPQASIVEIIGKHHIVE
jgi:cold shock CspA family protein